MSTSTTHYPVHPAAIRWLHWTTLLLLLAAFALVLLRDVVEERAARTLLLQAHRLAGLSVASLALARLAVRQRATLAPTDAGMSTPQKLAASALHALLYVLLLSIPLLGWALSSARGQAVALPLGVNLPALLAKDLDLADSLEQLHSIAAWSLAALAGLHAAAAIWHHRVRRDGVLVAMLPRLNGRN